MRTITIAVGRHRHLEPLRDGRVTSSRLRLEFVDHDVISRSFGDTVRDQPYDVAELALGAFLQARERHRPLVLLPVVLVGGFQHDCLRRSSSSESQDPESLRGGRIGVRSFSQTTGIWVRGILRDQFGIAQDELSWTVFEGSHAGIPEPGLVRRAPEGAVLLEMLSDGALDAAVIGPEAHGTSPLIADLHGAENAWYERTGVVNVNHFVSLREDVAADEAVVRELHRMLVEARELVLGPAARRWVRPGIPSPLQETLAPIESSVALGIRLAAEQGVISRPPDLASLFVQVAEDGGAR